MSIYKRNPAKTIDEYLTPFPQRTREILQELREFIQKQAPTATEAMSYGIPTFKLNGNLVHFAGYENHIGFYPGSKAMQVLKQEMKQYKTSKGTVQFSIEEPLPFDLIKKIVDYRITVNSRKTK